MADTLSVVTEGNVLHLAGRFAIPDIRRATAALYSIINVRGYSDIELDFGDLKFTHAPPMLALVAQVDHHRADGIDFSVKRLPTDYQLSRLFQNSNWAHFFDPIRFEAAAYSPAKHNPAKQFSDAGHQSAIVNETIDTLLKSLTGFDRDHLKAIEWSLNEITDNVLVHAQSPVGGYVQVTALKNRKMVEFVVVDGGIGIASSLRAGHSEINSDVDALSRAIQEGITRDRNIGQGNGLFGSYQIAVNSGGNFTIIANHATLYYTEKTGMHSRGDAVPFVGSLVVCGIDYTNPLLLERALRFNDRPHTPVDRIEIRYETDSRGEIQFKFADEAVSVGTRVAGIAVRQKLENLIRLTDAERVIVDFEGVHLISSSFADEVFGKLFVTLGAIQFSTRFQFKSCDPIIRKLIDKAIMQRAATGLT